MGTRRAARGAELHFRVEGPAFALLPEQRGADEVRDEQAGPSLREVSEDLDAPAVSPYLVEDAETESVSV